MFWDARKTGQLNDLYRPRLTFLQDNYEVYQDYALVGTGLAIFPVCLKKTCYSHIPIV